MILYEKLVIRFPQWVEEENLLCLLALKHWNSGKFYIGVSLDFKSKFSDKYHKADKKFKRTC